MKTTFKAQCINFRYKLLLSTEEFLAHELYIFTMLLISPPKYVTSYTACGVSDKIDQWIRGDVSVYSLTSLGRDHLMEKARRHLWKMGPILTYSAMSSLMPCIYWPGDELPPLCGDRNITIRPYHRSGNDILVERWNLRRAVHAVALGRGREQTRRFLVRSSKVSRIALTQP